MKTRIISIGIGLYKVQYKKYFFSKWVDYTSSKGLVWLGTKIQAEIISLKISSKWI